MFVVVVGNKFNITDNQRERLMRVTAVRCFVDSKTPQNWRLYDTFNVPIYYASTVVQAWFDHGCPTIVRPWLNHGQAMVLWSNQLFSFTVIKKPR